MVKATSPEEVVEEAVLLLGEVEILIGSHPLAAIRRNEAHDYPPEGSGNLKLIHCSHAQLSLSGRRGKQ
jgi:hypothetical protein